MGLDRIDLGLIFCLDLFEGFLMIVLDRFCRRRIHLERIDRGSVLPHTEVEVRSCRTAGRAYITYHFTLTNTLAGLEPLCIFRKVEISRRIYGIMLDSHRVATGALILHAGHYSVADGHDRSSCRSRVVYSRVRAHLLGHRMLACLGEA